jgi:hypothetical protein
MKRKQRLYFVILVSLSHISLLARTSEGFEDKAHTALSLRATQTSNLDYLLKLSYPFFQGPSIGFPIFSSEFPDGTEQSLVDGDNGRGRKRGRKPYNT